MSRRLTTTSYAILGLLAIKPWSTYELTKQMRRTFSHFWPRAESNVYAEPKRLVEAGLARAETQSVGRRPRTLYLITDAGIRALEQWVGTSSGPSHYESETLVKVLFGNHGSKDELLANLRAFHAEATAVLAQWATVAEDYDRGTQSFPDRAHINALIFRLVWDQAALNARWATWAIEHVEGWPDTLAPADLEASLSIFRAALPVLPAQERS